MSQSYVYLNYKINLIKKTVLNLITVTNQNVGDYKGVTFE